MTVPDDFDWVEARHQCSPFAQFAALMDGAKLAVEKRREQLGVGPRFGFNDMSQQGLSKFLVYNEETQTNVVFTLEGRTIKFHRHGEQLDHVLSLTLNDEGRCRFLLDGAELAPWQVLRRALEPVLFGT
jgi:hypothetical protein